MPLTTAGLRALFAAGATPEAILAAAEAEEAADKARALEEAERRRPKLLRKRALDRERQNRKRARDRTPLFDEQSPTSVPELAAASPGQPALDEPVSRDVTRDTPPSSSSPTPPLITTP